MNLGDAQLELIDPTPNIHYLFIQFDKMFFWSQLAGRAVVRWSKRMYSCAGVCSYEGRGGLCDIALSEPLLKLRPRKDLVQTLLHEMIHAFLFVASRDRDRDGHGPNFKAHMHRINGIAGINITIYHDFHDEVELYQTHWWRCTGPCQTQRPHFGIVRRPVNKAPGPSDYWWADHMRKCSGLFIKIKEPEKKTSKKAKVKVNSVKPNADITKYIDRKKPVTNNTPLTGQIPKSVLKDSNNMPVKTASKSNSASTFVVTKKAITFNPQINKPTPPLFSGKGQTTDGAKKKRKSTDVVETVRNVWANKQLTNSPLISTLTSIKGKESIRNNNTPKSNSVVTPNKHKADEHVDSRPTKVRKIDDYFKTASTLLKDIYGQDFNVTQPKDKLVASVTTTPNLVDCPICGTKISSTEINRHLDECLNKDVIATLNKDEVNLIDHQPTPNTVVNDKQVKKSDNFVVKEEKDVNIGYLPPFLDDIATKIPEVKIEPGTSIQDIGSQRIGQQCPCCRKPLDKPIEQHLDECLSFFDNNMTIPEDGASTSFANETIVIDDDDDVLDETLTMNATGTKVPCPCCLEMVEESLMNEHLDQCLS